MIVTYQLSDQLVSYNEKMLFLYNLLFVLKQTKNCTVKNVLEGTLSCCCV